MVTREDIGKLSTRPTLVFFNACQLSRVRGRQEDCGNLNFLLKLPQK